MKRNKLSQIIYTHIYNNARIYFISICIFLIGIIIGVFFINNIDIQQQETLAKYLENFIDIVKAPDYKLDECQLLKQSLKQNIVLGVGMWFIGSTIIGIPIIYGILCYKGFCLGYTIASIIGVVGSFEGIILTFLAIFLQNLFIIPAILSITVSSINFYKGTVKNRRKDEIKIEIIKHTLICMLNILLLVVASFVEIYVSSNLIIWFLNTFKN